MAEQLNLNINVTGNVNESLGSIKKQLREAQNEVTALSDKFGATSQEAIQAAKRAAELKDRIGDAKALTDAFNPDAKFKALSASLSGVAGGFAAVQGAIGLFGSESKELEKQLLKVQSALALSQGLQSIGESVDSFKQLGAVVKNQVVTAFSTLKGAIIATGIGALAIAIGLVAANFDKVKKVVLDLIPGLGSVADFIGNLVNKVTDFVGITSEAGRATAKLIEDNDKAIKNSERFLELNGDKYDEYTQRKLKANNDFKKQQNEFLKDEKLTEDERNFYIKQAREKANREILKADQDRYAKSEEDNKAAFEKQNKIDEERKKLKEEEDKKEQERLDKQRQAQANALKLALQASENKTKADEQQKKEDDDEVARLFALEGAIQQVKIDSNNNQLLKEKEFKQAQIQAEEELYNAKFAAASAGLNLLGSLLGQNEKIANAIFITDKALAVAKIVIDTIKETKANDLWGASLGPSGIAYATTRNAIARIKAATSIATIAATTIAKFKGGASSANFGGGGAISTSGVPIVPSQQPQAQLTQLNQASINALGNQAIKAYVVETDVTSSQQRIAAIQQRARFN